MRDPLRVPERKGSFEGSLKAYLRDPSGSLQGSLGGWVSFRFTVREFRFWGLGCRLAFDGGV